MSEIDDLEANVLFLTERVTEHVRANKAFEEEVVKTLHEMTEGMRQVYEAIQILTLRISDEL